MQTTIWRPPYEIRQSLRAAEIPQAWRQPSDRYGWAIVARILLPFLAAFALTPWIADRWPAALLANFIAMGVYGYKISFIMHDVAHGSLFRQTWLNNWVGEVCGWLVGTNYDVFRRTHMLHHKHNGDTLDPQYQETAGFAGASRRRLLNHLLLPLAGGRVIGVLHGYLGGYLRGSSERGPTASMVRRLPWFAAVAATQIVLAWLATDGGRLWWGALLYPGAAATIALFLARARTFAEHIVPEGPDRPDFVRSHRPDWFDAAFLYDAHFNYHLEHHLYPKMPSCHLKHVFRAHGAQIHSDATLSPSMVSTILRRVAETPR